MNLSEHFHFNQNILLKNLCLWQDNYDDLYMDPPFEKKDTDIMKLTVVIKLCIIETRW